MSITAVFFQSMMMYLFLDNGRPRPRPEHMTLLQADIRDVQPSAEFQPVDLVVSSSVYEHLDDVDGMTRALAALTRPDWPANPLCGPAGPLLQISVRNVGLFREGTWRGWLNPTSNHNRFRLWDYRRVFEKYFGKVEIQILQEG